MKTILYGLTIFALCCCSKSRVSIDARNLRGTWKSASQSGQPDLRWTFDADYLYMAKDSTGTCSPAEGQPWTYRIEDQTLVAHYVGISHGLVPIPDMRYQILALSDSAVALGQNRVTQHELHRCR